MRDAFLLCGFAAIEAGLYQAWPPAAWIVGGLVLCGGALASWFMTQQTKGRQDGQRD